MWKPNIEKKQGFISRWLERRRLVRPDMEDTQFHWKQVQCIKESQQPLSPSQKTIQNIPKTAKTVFPKESAVEIRLSSTAQGTAEMYVYAARKDDGIVEMARGMIKTGSQIIERDNQKCCCVDDIKLDNFWFTPHKVSSVQDGWARVMFLTHGYHRIFVHLVFQTGTWYVDMVGADKW